MMMIRRVATTVTVTAVLALAMPQYPALIPNGNNVVRNGQAWAGVGHVTPEGGTANNQFGLDFAAAGHSWTTALCNKDSDGDGYSNGAELGDPSCAWSVGRTPSRSSDISHPGFADSVPTTVTKAPPSTSTSTPATPTPNTLPSGSGTPSGAAAVSWARGCLLSTALVCMSMLALA